MSVAKEKNLFFMEAMWTRFQPLTLEVKRIAEEGTLGDPVVLHADLSHDFDLESAFEATPLSRLRYLTFT